MGLSFPAGDQPPEEQMRDMPFHVISCDVKQEHYKEGDHVGIGDRHFAQTPPKMKVAMRVYDRPSASIREYDLEAIVSELRTNVEPTIEDNSVVEVMDFVEIFVRAGVSMTDMRDYIGFALGHVLETEGVNPLHEERLLRLYRALGGVQAHDE